VSPIFWYRSFSVSAFSPCHGSEPRRKYINIWPSASRSSRLDCSAKKHVSTFSKKNQKIRIFNTPFPKCVLMLMYRAVPVNDLCSLYGMCLSAKGKNKLKILH
jgi:hypothetical protein